MKRNFLFALSAAALTAGCGGGGTDGGTVTTTTTKPVYPFAVTTNQFVSGAKADGTSGEEEVTLVISSTGQNALMGIGGTEYQLTRQADDSFLSADGKAGFSVSTQLPGGPDTGVVFFAKAFHEDGGLNEEFAHAGGFEKADPPATGTYIYDGVVSTFDALGGTGSGTVRLVARMDLPADGLSGTITGGYIPDPTAVFNLDPVDVPGKDVQFETTLTSPDVTVTDSRIEGQYYGAAADELAGTIRIQTADGAVVGFFDAID